MSDPIAHLAAVILNAGITCEYHEPDPECVECGRMASNLASEVVEAIGGEWWCALYLPDMNGVCTYESRHHHDGEGCHWMVPADVRLRRVNGAH